MGFLDTIFGAFTGSPAINAQKQSQGQLFNLFQQGTGTLNDFLSKGLAGLTSKDAEATDYLKQIFPQLASSYEASRGDLTGYTGQGLEALRSRFGEGSDALARATAAFDPVSAMAERFGKGSQLYADATGVNGPEGTARAQAAFQAGPGYNFMKDQGIDAINSARAARGQRGGNVDTAIADYTTGLANQEFGNWRGALAPYNAYEADATKTAATGRAGTLSNAADFARMQGGAESGILTGLGSGLAGLSERYGGNVGNTYGKIADLTSGTGRSLADLLSKTGGQIAGLTSNLFNPLSQSYTEQGKAGMQGSANLWNFLGGLFRPPPVRG